MPEQTSKKIIEKTTNRQKVLKFLEQNKTKIKYLYEFLFVIGVYGSLISFTLSVFKILPFNIKTILALGITYYFFKEELPGIINKSLTSLTKRK